MAKNTRVVLVAVDASDHAKVAFRWYAQEIHRKDDLVIICHIPEYQDLPAFSVKYGLNIPVDEWQRAMKEHSERIQRLEASFESELVTNKMRYKIISQHSKNPGQGIIDVAENEKASMLVVGTRGLDVLRRTLLGSVSDYVVRHSRVPVVVCPKAD